MATQIAIRRDTTANWSLANPILGDGEPALDETLQTIKYGDGITAYLSLPTAGNITDSQLSTLLGTGSSAATLRSVVSARTGVVNLLDFTVLAVGKGNATVDTAVLKAAISGAQLAGCDLKLPPISLTLNDAITLPAIVANVRKVGLLGSGIGVTSLRWSTDLGAGKFGIAAANGNTDTGECYIDGLSLQGPNFTRSFEATPCQMEGIEASRKMRLSNITSTYMKAGFRLNGDHVTFTNCYAPSSYFGVYFAGATIDGDISMIDCDWTGTTMASFGVGVGGRMSALSMHRGHMGFSPYGIFIEPGVAATNSDTVVYGASFYGTSWESFGAGACYDSDAVGQWRNMHFYDVGNFSVFSTVAGTAYTPTRGRPALYRTGTMTGWLWDQFGVNGGGATGDATPDAMFSAGAYGILSCQINGTVSDVFQPWITAGKKLIAAGGAGACQLRFNGFSESGFFRTLSDQGPVSQGMLVATRTQASIQPNDGGGRMIGVARFAESTLGAGVLVIESAELAYVNIGSTMAPVLSALIINPSDPTKLGPRSLAATATVQGAATTGDLAANSLSQVFFRARMA